MTVSTTGLLQSYSREGRTLTLDCGGPRLAISVLSPRIVRVRLAPEGTFAPRRSWDVVPPDEEFPETPFEVRETDEALLVHIGAGNGSSNNDDDSGLSLHIRRNPCRISFADAEGRSFCRDYGPLEWREPDIMSVLPVWSVACTKHIEAGEHFFGFGQRTSLLERSGRQMNNWTTDPGSKQGPGSDPLYIAIPAFLALRPGLAYGVFFHTTWRSRFDIGHTTPDTWRMEAVGGELDYYVVYGPTPPEVMQGWGALLGTLPLPPRWSLGYHQSRWSYAPESHVREVAASFRQRAIPCDVIHLDIAYMDGYRVFTWDPERFPNPRGLLADLRREGFRAVTIIDPGVKIDPDYAVYREGLERDAFIRRADGEHFHGYVWPDDAVFCDYTRPEVREWWGNWHRALLEQGVSGIWNDMNEPTSFHQPFSKVIGRRTWDTLPLDARQGPEGETTIHAEVHNLFGNLMSRATYEALRRHGEGNRPFVLPRSAFAGVQRWSACWMGDNGSWWEHLEMAIPQLMNMGLSGVPFVGVDIGGFGENASGELFARWMQFGSLSPFCRGHTTHFSADHEPWAFGEEVEEICRAYLRLRYRLLPYLYTLFWEASRRGSPVVRPLLYHFPDDPATYHLHDQLMLGPFLLAAPVYHPGRTHRALYLPAGTWYDWWSGEKIEGPGYLLARAPLATMPLYLRAGTILPTGPEMNHTDEKQLDPLTLNLYPGNGTFTLYEDDGHTFEHERGLFCTTRYRLALEEADTLLRLEIGERTGSYHPPARRLTICVHAIGEEAARAAAAEYPGTHYDAHHHTLSLTLDQDDGRARTLTFRYCPPR